jgi:hypothetical protein
MAIDSKYSVLSNRPVTKDFSGAYYEIFYNLPFWFTNWSGKKIIKVYGYSFVYLESENLVPKPSSIYANQFISVHSNIVRDDSVSLHGVYSSLPPTQSETEVDADFMMTVNNFYTPNF